MIYSYPCTSGLLVPLNMICVWGQRSNKAAHMECSKLIYREATVFRGVARFREWGGLSDV